LWGKFKDVSSKTDRRFLGYIDILEQSIEEMAELDSNGQTFRYAYDRENKLHLKSISTINLGDFYLWFMSLKSILNEMIVTCFAIRDEYKLGTYNDDLSRRDLCQISNILPNYDLWTIDNSIDLAVDKIRKKFSLSKRKCCKAIDIIKKHPEFASRIGLEKPFDNAKEEHFRLIMLSYKKFMRNGKKSTGPIVVDFSDVNTLDMFLDYSRRKDVLINEVSSKLDVDIILDIYTTFLIGRNKCKCEQYDSMVSLAKEEASSGIRLPLDDMFGSKNTEVHLLWGLSMLGKNNMIKSLCMGHKICTHL